VLLPPETVLVLDEFVEEVEVDGRRIKTPEVIVGAGTMDKYGILLDPREGLRCWAPGSYYSPTRCGSRASVSYHRGFDEDSSEAPSILIVAEHRDPLLMLRLNSWYRKRVVH
jgi:hypothetical protein